MYLNDGEEAEVLLRLIDDCTQLVDAEILDPKAAFAIISEASKHHSDHPLTKERRLKKFAEKAEIQAPAPMPIPEPVPVADTDLATNF